MTMPKKTEIKIWEGMDYLKNFFLHIFATSAGGSPKYRT